MRRITLILTLLLAPLLALAPLPAAARVLMQFHSFNGSYLIGRYPHAFVSLDGTLDGTGQKIHENYGYSTSAGALTVVAGGLHPGVIQVEKEKYVRSTNVHFTVTLSDAQYHAIVAEVAAWKDGPGVKRYSLDHNNCLHFVAKLAEMVGINAPVPQNMVRRPKLWLNWVGKQNPQLGAREIS